jgi:hypothetical protein
MWKQTRIPRRALLRMLGAGGAAAATGGLLRESPAYAEATPLSTGVAGAASIPVDGWPGAAAVVGNELEGLPSRVFQWQDPTVVVTIFAGGHGWSATGAGVGSSDLNDTSDFARGIQAARITTAGNALAANLQQLAGSALDLTGKQIRLLVKFDNVVRVADVNFFVGTSSLANSFKWRLKNTSAAQEYIQAGEWVALTFGWADVDAAAGAFSLTGGLPSTTTGFTDLRFQVIDNGSGAATFRVNGIEILEDTKTRYPGGVVSIAFDDSNASQYDLARPKMDALGFRGTQYTIVDRLGTPAFLTLSQLRSLQNSSGWEVAGHAYTAAAHDTRYSTLTAAACDDELRQLKAWLVGNGFPAESFAYPGGIFSATTDGVPIDQLVSRYFTSGRTILYNRTIEQKPVGVPMRLRAVSSISKVIGSGNRAYPANLAGPGGLLDRCAGSGSWLILTFHKITAAAATTTTECEQADFDMIMDGIASRGIKVLPVGEVIEARNG